MGPLAALLIATPVFGFSLSIGGLEPQLPAAPPQGLGVPALVAPLVPEVAVAPDVAPPAPPPDATTPDVATPPPAVAPVAAPPPVTPAAAAATAAADAEEERYEHDLRQRTQIAKIHRTFAILTWASMGVTLLFGGVQYHNLYGEYADIAHNPCVTGQGVIFGGDQCYGTPWLHAITEGVTSALYFTTLTLSFLMPDPDHSDQGNSEFANKLRWHKILRWVHLGGMIAQIVLGLVIANTMDRTRDYNTLEALATVHMGIGILTYAAVTTAGALMTF